MRSQKQVTWIRISVLAPAAVLAALLGCASQPQARPARLSGDPADAVTLKTIPGGRYGLHDVQLFEEDGDTIITGHMGPVARETHRPTGHVDVTVLSPEGRVISVTTGTLQPTRSSPRVPTELRFRASVPGRVPAGCEVAVEYHASLDDSH